MESDKIKTNQYIVNIVKDFDKRERSVTINATTTMAELQEIVADQIYEGYGNLMFIVNGKRLIGAPPSKLDPQFHYHTLANTSCFGANTYPHLNCNKVNPLGPELEKLIQQEKRESIWLEAMSKYEADASVTVSSCEGFQWNSEDCEYNLSVHVVTGWTEYSLTCTIAPTSPTPAATTKQCIIF